MKNTLKDVASSLQCRTPVQLIQIQLKYSFTWNTNNEKILKLKVLLFFINNVATSELQWPLECGFLKIG
jgi:hypothetical protein